MPDHRRHARPPFRPLALAICLHTLCAQAADTVETTTDAPAQDAPPTLNSTPGQLPPLQTAGERLGWMTREEIAQLPADKQPTHLDATCPGAWVTPIPANVRAAPMSTTDIAAFADNAHYQDNGDSELTGQVRITQPGREMDADKGTITRNREYAHLEGNIRLAEPGVLMTGDEAIVNMNTTAGQMLSSEFVSNPLNAHGRAEEIVRQADGVTHIKHGMITTCAPGRPFWLLDARDIDLDPEDKFGVAHAAKLRIDDVPLLYLPYWRFPLTRDRLTGFLVPRISNSSLNGVDLTAPIYLNLAPNYDATITPRYMSKRGLLMNGEFRYLTPGWGGGQISGGYLNGDQITGSDRKALFAKHAVNFNNGWSANGDFNYVSDSTYLTDFSRNVNAPYTVFQDRTGELHYDSGRIHFLTRAQSFQTLSGTFNDASRPYGRLPELLLTIDPSRMQGWQVGLRAETTNFQKSFINDGSAPEINGIRTRIDPTLGYDLSTSWGYARPGVRLSALNYEVNGADASTVQTGSLLVPTFHYDTGLYFDRTGADGSTQTIEPRLYYLYAPYKNQSTSPNFDTAYNTFTYDQLFRDSRFSGGDRLDDANQLSLGTTSRWINNEGFERAQVSAGQVLYFRDRLVQLPGTVVSTSSATTPTSDYAGKVKFNFTENTSIHGDALVDPNTNRMEEGAVDLSYLPVSERSVYNVGYRYRRSDPSLNQTSAELATASFIHPFNDRWKAVGLINYDVSQHTSQNLVLGVQYETCCWAVRVFKHSYMIDPALVTPTSGTGINEISVEFLLKGLAGMVSGLDSLLARSVFGYTQLNNAASATTYDNPYMK